MCSKFVKSNPQDNTLDQKLTYLQFQVLNLYHFVTKKEFLGTFMYTGVIYIMFKSWGILKS